MGFDVFRIVFGLIKGPRWRKASKCKSLIKQVKRCLMIQMNRRNAIIRQSRADIAQLLQNGLQHIVLSRVEQLYKDQCTFSAYAQIDQFCDYIYEEIHEISRSSGKLSKDAREALSSLIFAASRCGELPELHLMRNLFKRQFGHHFERVNVELLPGNNVNSQLKYNITEISSIPDDTKLQLMKEIAKEFTLHSGSSQIKDQEFDPNVPKLQMSNLSHKKCELNEKIVGSNFSTQNNSDYPANKDQRQGSIFKDMIRKIGTNFRLSDCTKLVTTHCDSLDCTKGKVISADYSTKTNNARIQELAIVNLDGIEEQSLTEEEYSIGNLDSWVENVSSKTIYGKKKRNSSLMKNDNGTNNCKILANKQGSDVINSCKEIVIVGQFCDREVEEDSEPRLSHVHPKLPDYDELVEKFTDLKRDYMQKNSKNQVLRKWLHLRW